MASAPGLLLTLLLSLSGIAPSAGGEPSELRRLPDVPLWQHLEARVQTDPRDATAWRLLGRLREQAGDRGGALQAFERAASLNPASAAAQFDLARLLDAVGQPDRAVACWQEVVQLAPDSDYGVEAVRHLQSRGVIPVSFQPAWVAQPAVEPPPTETEPPRLAVRVKSGVLYNSNVAMTPLSRGIAPLSDGSFQALLAPDLEYRLGIWDRWQAGLLFAGEFLFNEGNLGRLNLQHYQPGVFLQRPCVWVDSFWVPRVEYNFAYDAFDGHRFGTRHALATVLEVERPSGNAWLVFWALDWTDFDDDGEVPAITSLDGWTHTVGASYLIELDRTWLSTARLGVNVQWADLVGSSFTYHGWLTFIETESPFLFGSVLKPRLGWGNRDYPDYPFRPSRNETLWHAALKIERWLSPHWLLTTHATFDRFDSRDNDFDADRLTAGGYLTYER